jgi:hypothetical protein
MSNDHALYSPSRLERILLCPGSVQAALVSEEEKTSSYAEHGTLLHRATDEASDLGLDAISYITPEDKELVAECLDYKQGIINSLGHKDYTVSQELKVSLTSWGIPEVYGTLDLGIHDKKARHAHIVDWKFGSGVVVYALWNPQLLSYGAGFIGNPPIADTITVHIVQPAISHYDRWTVTVDKLQDWLKTKLSRAVALAQGKHPPLHPGEEQCRWCPAASRCPARHQQTMDDARRMFEATQNIQLVGNEEVAELLAIVPRLKDAIKKVQVFAQQELERGRAIPGFKLVEGRNTRAWVDEDDAFNWLSQHGFESDDLFKMTMVSPFQAESKRRALKKDPEFQKLIAVKPGNPTVVPDDHAKPALQPSNAAIDVFRNVEI